MIECRSFSGLVSENQFLEQALVPMVNIIHSLNSESIPIFSTVDVDLTKAKQNYGSQNSISEIQRRDNKLTDEKRTVKHLSKNHTNNCQKSEQQYL